jgi:CBS domain-containing protein
MELCTMVGEVLERKGHCIHDVSPETSVYDALKLMAEKNVGAVLVLDGDHLMGIMSERDYARKVVLAGRLSHGTKARDIMTPNPICIERSQTIGEAMAIMTHRRIRHLPVLDQGQLVGLISIGDVVKAVIAEQEYMIEQLERFVAGQPMGSSNLAESDLSGLVD